MTIKPLIILPDPILRQVSEPVERIDDAVRAFADDMLETMYAAPGIGLAAPQIGVARRVFVMDPGWKDGTPAPLAVIEPALTPAGRRTAGLTCSDSWGLRRPPAWSRRCSATDP